MYPPIKGYEFAVLRFRRELKRSTIVVNANSKRGARKQARYFLRRWEKVGRLLAITEPWKEE